MAVFGGLVRSMPWVRDRLIADDKFLFKVFAEVIIDTGEPRAAARMTALEHACWHSAERPEARAGAVT